MSNASPAIEFLVGPDGRVYRRVTRILGTAPVVTSEVPVAPDIDTFRDSYPDTPVIGTSTSRAEKPASVQDLVSKMSDDELEAMGLLRVESTSADGVDDDDDDDDVEDEDEDEDEDALDTPF